MAQSSNESFYEEIDDLSISLSTFVDLYGTQLPQVVNVAESIYQVDGGSLEGQHLQVYFKKETRVVDVSLSSRNYVVPINSQLKASVLYNPHNNLEKAKEGYYFATVADLVKAVPQPFVVSVGKNWMSPKNPSVSLQKGQILIVVSPIRKGRSLICIDAGSNTSIRLEDTCEGHFTTQPASIAINLHLLVEHVQLPLLVSFNDEEENANRWFQNETGYIGKQHLLQSIIAVKGNQYEGDLSKVFEILSSVPIYVEVIQISEENKVKLIIQSQKLANVLNPSLLTEVSTSLCPDLFQEEILKFVQEEAWRRDVHEIDVCQKLLFPADHQPQNYEMSMSLPNLFPSSDFAEYDVLPQRRQLTLPLSTNPRTNHKIPPLVPFRRLSCEYSIDKPPLIPPRHNRTIGGYTSDTDDSSYAYGRFYSATTGPYTTSSETISTENELIKQLSELRENNIQLTVRLHELENALNGRKHT